METLNHTFTLPSAPPKNLRRLTISASAKVVVDIPELKLKLMPGESVVVKCTKRGWKIIRDKERK